MSRVAVNLLEIFQSSFETLANHGRSTVAYILSFILASTAIGLPAQAGVLVVQSGVIKSWTPSNNPDSPAVPGTVYFYQGSYNQLVTNGRPPVVYPAGPNNDSYLEELKADIVQINNVTDTNTYLLANTGPNSGPTSTSFSTGLVFNVSGSWTKLSYYQLEKDDQTVTAGGRSLTFFFATSIDPDASTVPEPNTAIAMGMLGVVGFAGNRRRRRQMSAA